MVDRCRAFFHGSGVGCSLCGLVTDRCGPLCSDVGCSLCGHVADRCGPLCSDVGCSL